MGGDGHFWVGALEQAFTGSSLKYYRLSGREDLVALSLSVAIHKATFLFIFLENSFLQPTLSLPDKTTTIM